MENKILSAQYLLKDPSSSFSAGFNMKIFGETYQAVIDCYDSLEKMQGFEKAEEMIKDGKIYYTHVFKCGCGDHPFLYGGFFVCNKCGGKGVDEKWWGIRIQKDGNEYCCTGENFEDLQSSKNYAFGKTFKDSIDNYENLMRGETKTALEKFSNLPEKELQEIKDQEALIAENITRNKDIF